MLATEKQIDLSKVSAPKLFGKLFTDIPETEWKSIRDELIKRYDNNDRQAISILELFFRIQNANGFIPQFNLKAVRATETTPKFPKRVFDIITSVPRNEFFPAWVKAALQELPSTAREQIEKSNFIIAAKNGVTLSEPILVSQMALLLDIKDGDKILDVGSGLGYHAAVLAKLAPSGFVYGVERDLESVKSSRKTLKQIGINNVKIQHTDGRYGLSENAPFDKINVACRCDGFPDELLMQLKVGGKMVIPVENKVKSGKSEFATELMYLVERKSEGEFLKQPLWSVFFVPMQKGIE